MVYNTYDPLIDTQNKIINFLWIYIENVCPQNKKNAYVGIALNNFQTSSPYWIYL